MKKHNRKLHIMNSQKKFGANRFDYSLFTYTLAKKEATYTCLWHDKPYDFITTPDNHLQSVFGGCDKCSKLSKKQGSRQNEHSLAHLAINKHRDRFPDLHYIEDLQKGSTFLFTCSNHGKQRETVIDFYKYQCKKCRAQQVEAQFYSELTPELKELYTYPKLKISHTFRLEIALRWLRHCVTNITPYLLRGL